MKSLYKIALLVCISENTSLRYDTVHQGKYIHVCGVKPYWKDYLNSIGVEYNSLKAGLEVYKFYLNANNGDKKAAILDFKGAVKSKKVKKIVDKILVLEREIKWKH